MTGLFGFAMHLEHCRRATKQLTATNNYQYLCIAPS